MDVTRSPHTAWQSMSGGENSLSRLAARLGTAARGSSSHQVYWERPIRDDLLKGSATTERD
jgi:hypothetical protein